jgi:hypothetical protein
MGKKLYVGNLSYETTDADLEAMFTPYGTVQSVQLIMDRDTGRSKGFGFVEMGSDEARPMEDRGGGRGGTEAARAVAAFDASRQQFLRRASSRAWGSTGFCR